MASIPILVTITILSSGILFLNEVNAQDETLDTLREDIESLKEELGEKGTELDFQIILAVFAIITAGGTGLFNYFFSKKQKEHDAYTSYVFDARKKLYEKCEPILFQYNEYSDSAIHTITGLARSARLGKLEGENNWLGRPGYYLKSIVYRLLIPHAAFKLLQRQLTSVDLNLDSKIKNKYLITKILYYTLPRDFELASNEPSIEYDPEHSPLKRSDLEANPSKFRKQGIYAGVLDKIINGLIIKEQEGEIRLATFGEFEEKITNKPTQPITAIMNLFTSFHPQTSPVLWRILLAQARLYKTFMNIHKLNADFLNFETFQTISQIDRKSLDWRQQNQVISDDEVFTKPMAAVENFIREQLTSS